VLGVQEANSFVVLEWIDGSVVFDKVTGNTHALDRLTCDVLIAAQNSFGSKAKLLVMLKPFHSHIIESEFLGLVQECLDRLIVSGLLEPGICN